MKPSPELRALRLWHWRSAMEQRTLQAHVIFPSSIRHHQAKADFHIKAVQTLNDYFNIDDTAEKDAGK